MRQALTDLPFYKFSATGNDFILLDNRTGVIGEPEEHLFRQLCERRVSVGADGVLLIEKSSEFDFRMRYFNADGGESEMCGNGARSAAYFAYTNALAEAKMTFAVGNDVFEAEIQEDQVKLKMPWPRDVREAPGVLEEAFLSEGGFLNTGVPHYVVFADHVKDLDVSGIGYKYRWHSAFQPAGTNVDFVEVLSPNQVRVRTYERGVERETLSCGTGCVASAYISQMLHKTTFPTEIVTDGGLLQVSVAEDEKAVYLQGAVKLVYEGILITP